MKREIISTIGTACILLVLVWAVIWIGSQLPPCSFVMMCES